MRLASHFEERGKKMLKRWGEEVLEGESSDNIIARIDSIKETGSTPGGWPPKGAAAYSPLAAEADIILRELMELDRDTAEYLTAYALGLSISDMVRVMEIKNRSAANIEFKEAIAKWTMAVYYRSRDAREWLDKLTA